MLGELRSEINCVVEAYCDEPALRDCLLRVLFRTGFALHPKSRCMAGLLTLEIYRAIRGTLTDAALKAAVSVELCMEAAFIFDNIADQEIDSEQDMNIAEELTVAIGLMSCGGIAACEAGRLAEGDARGLALLLQLQKGCLGGCGGQMMDAHLQEHGLVSTEEALEMTCRKSGSLGRSAAVAGAIIATDDPRVINLFGEFGFNLFTYLQLLDDLRDACPTDGNIRDLEQNKKTLPLAYFYNYMLHEYSGQDNAIIPLKYDEWSGQDIRREYSASGSDVFCSIIAETYLNRAKSNLVVLKDLIMEVEGLEQFVSSAEISPDEVFAAV